MSVIIVRPGDLVVQDPNDSKVYAFDWATENLPVGIAIVYPGPLSITGLNPSGAALNLAVTSFTVDGGGVAHVTTETPHGYTTNDSITIDHVVPAEYNFTFAVIVTSPTTFTYSFGIGNPITDITRVTASKGLDNVAVLTSPPYNSQWVQFRFTPNGYLGALFEIANRILTTENPPQTKERSFRILVQNL
jgi:hypothetical protein